MNYILYLLEKSEKDLRQIGLAYANYVYPKEDQGMFPFEDKEMLANYIVGFARSCMQSGMLYTFSCMRIKHQIATAPYIDE